MPFELISEKEMATKSKKEKTITKSAEEKKVEIKESKEIKIIDTKDDIKIIDKKDDIKIIDKKDDIKIIEKDGGKVSQTNVIVKKVYFPGEIYSNNQAEFKKILGNYGLSWFRPLYKMHVSKTGVKLASGVYISADKNKRVLCIYEGSKKPMTAVIKIVGTGGNFLIEMNSFCTRVGCIVEDKDESYSDKVTATLKERGEIYVEGMEDTVAEKLKKGDISIEEKIKKMVDDTLQKYVDAYKDSLERKGVSLETFKFFKRKDIERDIRWAIENQYIELE